jgi:hypothetical protein
MERQVTNWRKSRASANGGEQCVEVGTTSDGVAVRDTKDNGNGPVLRVSPDEWRRFTTSAKS